MGVLSRGVVAAAVVASSMIVGGCQFDGGPVFEDGEQAISIGQAVNDAAPLSARVRDALRRSPETALQQIRVSTMSEDTVRLSGFVDTDATRYEAERVAGNVEGVRFVDNALNIRRF